jgi:hypothetical protein
MTQRFVLHVLDKMGLPINASPFYVPHSLQDAARVGHLFQKDGCTVTITDEGETPPKEYTIDESGKPIPI